MMKALQARFNRANNFGGTMNRAFSAGGLVLFTNPGTLSQANVECCAFGAKRKRGLATARLNADTTRRFSIHARCVTGCAISSKKLLRGQRLIERQRRYSISAWGKA